MELNWRASNSVVMIITPPIASAWLSGHNNFNRPMKRFVVDQYVKDLRSGRWPLTHQGVAFDWNGQLIDGQHRLTAVVAADISVEMYVTTGLDPLTRPVVDTHSKRNSVDAYSLAGMKVGFGSVGKNSAAGMWSRMMLGLVNTKGRDTRSELIAFRARYSDAGEWTLNQFGQWPRYRYVQTAPVMAAVARAYYHAADMARLAQFVDVLSTGVMKTPDDLTAIHFRNALTTSISGNSNEAPNIYGKTCRAIQYFLRRETVTRFYTPQEEPFPLPDRSTSAPAQGVDRMVGDNRQLVDRRREVTAMAKATYENRG